MATILKVFVPKSLCFDHITIPQPLLHCIGCWCQESLVVLTPCFHEEDHSDRFITSERNSTNVKIIYSEKSEAVTPQELNQDEIVIPTGTSHVNMCFHIPRVPRNTSKFESVTLLLYEPDLLTKSAYFCDGNHGDMEEFEITSSLANHVCKTQTLNTSQSSKTRSNNACDQLVYAVYLTLFWKVLDQIIQTLRLKVAFIVCNTYLAAELRRWHLEIQELRSSSRVGTSKLRDYDRVARRAVDMLLGLCLLYILKDTSLYNDGAQALMSFAKTRVSDLPSLLQWMMGAPAGLKLNKQLSEFLGKFFLYHVYLWSGYLALIEPVMPTLLWTISIVSCFGLTMGVALVQDLISMMTLHIYCFYVYGARLFNLQMRSLASLWRLFRGKKWNSLRQRVDSARYDVDQLFVGTLLLTTLVFLLPTTALYYCVFLLIRLLVITFQTLVSALLSLSHKWCPYLLTLKLLNSCLLNNSMELHVLGAEREILYIDVKMKSATIEDLLCLIQDQKPSITIEQYSWGKLLQMICWGELLYPWITKSA